MSLKITGTEGDEGGEEALRRLVERACKGDAAVLPELRRFLDGHPSVWRLYGDLALHAEEALIELAAGENLLLRESLKRRLDELKAELAPSGPLERILAGRVAASWLACAHADALAAQARGEKAGQAEAARRRQDSAQRRLLESVRLLATVRKLLGPRSGSRG